MTALAPVLVFAYNRPEHLRKALEALANNILADQTRGFVFVDGPKSAKEKNNVLASAQVAGNTGGFDNVETILADSNKGLANSIISGVTKILESHSKVIVLEDDLVTSPYFLRFMNNALDVYAGRDDIFSISGFNHPVGLFKLPGDYAYDVLFTLRPMSWGWGTWRDSWVRGDWSVTDFEEFKNSPSQQKAFNLGGADLTEMLFRQMAGQIDSWAIRWSYTLFRNKAYSLNPRFSYVQNIGNDGSGIHCGKTNLYDVDLSLALPDPVLPTDLEADRKVLKAFRRVYAPISLRRLYRKLNLRIRELA